MFIFIIVGIILAAIALALYFIRHVPEGNYEVESVPDQGRFYTLKVRSPGYHLFIPRTGRRFDLVESASYLYEEIYSDEHNTVVLTANYRVAVEAIPLWHRGNPEEIIRKKVGVCLSHIIYDFDYLIPKNENDFECKLRLLSEIMNNLGRTRLHDINVALDWVEFNLFPKDRYISSPASVEGVTLSPSNT